MKVIPVTELHTLEPKYEHYFRSVNIDSLIHGKALYFMVILNHYYLHIIISNLRISANAVIS